MDDEQRTLIEASERKLEVAERLFDSGDLPDAVSRAYYGMFHAARALLLEKDSQPKTHQGVISELGKLFRDEIDRDLISSMSEIQSLREDADYEPYFDIDESLAEDSIEKARRLLEEAKNVLEK